MNVIHTMANWYSQRRYACLFFSLLISMIAAPMLGAMGVGTGFMEAFLALNILAATLITLFAFGTYVGLGLMALVLAARGGHLLFGYQPLIATSQGFGAAVCLISACLMLRFILSEGSVTSERIFAALDVYLLVGILCGLLFAVFEEQWPGSFSFQGSSLAGSKQNTLAHTIYFSFVTLGTLGYGDVLPIGGHARALAVAESIGGQMYLVVVVARLVSLYKGEADRKYRNERDGASQADNDPES